MWNFWIVIEMEDMVLLWNCILLFSLNLQLYFGSSPHFFPIETKGRNSFDDESIYFPRCSPLYEFLFGWLAIFTEILPDPLLTSHAMRSFGDVWYFPRPLSSFPARSSALLSLRPPRANCLRWLYSFPLVFVPIEHVWLHVVRHVNEDGNGPDRGYNEVSKQAEEWVTPRIELRVSDGWFVEHGVFGVRVWICEPRHILQFFFWYPKISAPYDEMDCFYDHTLCIVYMLPNWICRLFLRASVSIFPVFANLAKIRLTPGKSEKS